MNANAILLQKKYARVIELYADKYHVSPETALGRFYKSYLYHQISDGISDLHCMSDDYLADELNEEWSLSKYYSIHFVRVTDNAVIIRFVSDEKLKLHIVRVGFYDDFGIKINVNIGTILAVISEDGYSEKNIPFPDEELPEEDERASRSSSLRIGTFVVLRKMIKDTGIEDILKNYFTEKDMGLFLDLAAYSIIDESNAAQYYPSYAYNHPLFTRDMRIFR